MQYTSDIITILDTDGTICYVSPAVERVLGYRPEELLGSLAFGYVHPDDVERTSRVFSELLDNPGINPPMEYRVRHADGSWRYIELMINNLLDDPSIKGVLISARDITERKRAGGRIRFQAQLLDMVGQAVVATDLQGNVTYWNRCAEEVYGWSAEEMMGHPVGEVLVSQDQRERADEIMAELRAGRSWSGEFLVQRKDGTTFPALVTDTPVHDEQGSLVGVIGVSTDITQRKEAEEALRESEGRFRKLYDEAFEGIGTHDGERILGVNQTLADMLGYEKEELVGKPYSSLATLGFIRAVREHFSSGSEEPYEGTVIKKDGGRLDVEVRGRNIPSEGHRERLVSFRDVTERKQAEETLRESEKWFRTLTQNSYDVTTVLDGQGIILYQSPAVRQILGDNPEEKTGKSVIEPGRVHQDDLEKVRGAFAYLIANPGEAKTVEYRMRHANGSWRYIESVGVNLLDDSDVCGVVVNYRDVTERKQTEEALRESEQQYRTIVDTASEGVWTLDAQARTTYVNQRMADMLGYTVGEMLNSSLFDFVDDAAREEAMRSLERCRQGIREDQDFRFRRKDRSDL